MDVMKKPLPLSCLLHGVLILGTALCLGLKLGDFAQPPVAEVIMEAAPEEIATQDVSRENGQNPLDKESVRQHVSEQGPSAAAPARQTAGSQALLPAGSAASGGDGVIAAGAGSLVGGGGTAESGGDTGHYESGAAGRSEAAAAPPPAVPQESVASIASRFAARVEANKEYPYMAVKRGLTGVVSVTAVLSSEGDLTQVYVSASSGASVLDKAALQAVRNACPFAHGANRSINITVPIHFDLQ